MSSNLFQPLRPINTSPSFSLIPIFYSPANSRMIIYAVDPIKRTTRRGKQRGKCQRCKQLSEREKVSRTSEEDNRVQDENEVAIDSAACAARLGIPIRGTAYRVSALKRRITRVCAYRITETNNALEVTWISISTLQNAVKVKSTTHIRQHPRQQHTTRK